MGSPFGNCFSRELRQIKAPTLVAWGDRDALFPRGEQEALVGAIPSSQLVVYPGAGHAAHWEELERFASDLLTFIETVAKSIHNTKN